MNKKKFNSNTIELTVHTSCYCLELTVLLSGTKPREPNTKPLAVLHTPQQPTIFVLQYQLDMSTMYMNNFG